MEAGAVLPRFGTEQLLQYLKAQQPPVAVTVAAPSASSRALLAAARADPTQAPLLQDVHVVPPLPSQVDEAGGGGGPGGSGSGSGNNGDDAQGNPEALLAFVGRGSANAGASSSNGGGAGAMGPVLVIAPARAPSPAPEQDEQLQKQQLNGEPGQVPRFVAAVLPGPGAAGQGKNDNGGLGLAAPSNGHAAGAQAAAAGWPPRQDGAGCVATGVEWARLGLPPLVVDVQNPPFLWPRDYERREAAARLVEARWWDPSHGQLNLVLGRRVHAGNALEVVTAETHRADGTLALAGLESVFVTVRHEFGLMARLLADGYRIHHAAGGGTQVVLLRRFVKVEVPTAGTHIVRSKVILFRRRSRLLAATTGANGANAGGGNGGVVRGRPTGSGVSPLASPGAGAEQQPEAFALGLGDSSPGKALLGMRRRSRSVGSQAEAAGWEEGDEEDVEIFMFRRRAKGIWKMPGGHVEMKELADEAAVRELREETGYACKVLGMVALTERKDVGKKWGCSQLMFTFAAEWRESEMRLDDATSREGRWFPLAEMDALVAKDSAALDPPLKKVWPSFRARDRWFTHHAECVDPGYEWRKRYYMAAPAHPKASPDTVADTAGADTAAGTVQQLAVVDDGNGLAAGAAPQGGGRPSGGNDPASLSSLRRLSLSESCASSIGCSSSDWSRS